MYKSQISVNFQLSNIKLPDVLWNVNIHAVKLLMDNSIDNDKIASKLHLMIK